MDGDRRVIALVDARDAGMGVGGAEDFQVQQVVDRKVEGEAGLAGDQGRARRRRDIGAAGGAGGGLLRLGAAENGVRDRAVAGAAAEIALHGHGQFGQLGLIQGGGGHDHAGGAETALKALCGEEFFLHGVQRAGLRQALYSGDFAAGGAKSGEDAAMHGHAVHMHGAGAAVAGVAAFFDAEGILFAQQSAQALARARRGFDGHAVEREIQVASSRRISSARMWVTCRRQAGWPWTSS